MFLKNLTLKGFKSFAESATLDLEPGVTVVVGPNGSGKSNVVDAVAWVLGAQAPSSVRSQKMDDVIFAGSTRRPALGRAEVSLTIDNSAGLLPVDFAEVSLTRTLFRSGESEYAINGVPCRLLDIQELLSDSGVGRMQHVIIGQGQIDAVLNAKPTDRRLVIEEAAGVLKYRRRKEKAERRLAATEANLTRVQDLLREVRRGLRPLERQAEAARRHGALVAELEALRRHLAGRDLAQLRSRLVRTTAQRSEHRDADEVLRRRLRDLDAAVLAAESELQGLGGSDLGDDVTRFEGLRERARGLRAVLTERQRSLARERESVTDAALVSSLEADRARLSAELEEIATARTGLVPEEDHVGQAERGLEDARAAYEHRWGEGSPAAAGEAGRARAELSALVTSLERAEADRHRLVNRSSALADRRAHIEDEAHECARLLESLAGTGPELREAARRAADALAAAERDHEAARTAASEAEAELRSWQARAGALRQALDAARVAAGTERLGGLPGIVGTLLDLVELDPGWEGAFEAAAADALAAVVVDGTDRGRMALEALAGGEIGGAVLALGSHPRSPRPGAGVPVGALVRDHVRSSVPGVDELLDVVVGSAIFVDGDWEAGLEVALAHPDLVVVTGDGARFGSGTWRVGTTARAATGAALADADERVAAATSELEARRAAAASAATGLDSARRSARSAEEAAVAADADRARASESLERLRHQLEELASEADEVAPLVAELDERIGTEGRRAAELESALPALDAEERAAGEAAAAMRQARSALDSRGREVSAMRADLEVRAAQLGQRETTTRQRLSELDRRLARHADQVAAAATRRSALETQALSLRRLSDLVARVEAGAEAELEELRARRREESEAQRRVSLLLDGHRRERAEAERAQAELRERIQRSELDLAEVNLRIETAVEAMRRDLDIDPEAALAAPCPDLDEGVSAVARARELERELRLLGPVNPLALEEYEALRERHEFLQAQLDDVKSGRRELAKVIRAIDDEIVHVFAAAYADVAENFTHLFATLFPGGYGALSLTDPEDLLGTGIEIEAKPSGKNVRKLSLLSGGERSLTALAFLFAVFRSRPSPFYVMDEVEAALDDVNLHRFLDLVDEFRQEAQLMIVSHQKRTMEAADVLYGVTMAPGGSSKVVSERGAAAGAA